MSIPTSLYEKAAQLVFPRLGSNLPPPVTVEEDEARVAALLDRCPVGGLVLFNGRLPETPQVLARLQARSRFPLLIGTDMERGVGQQIHGATVFPHAMAYSALGEDGPDLLAASARIAAQEALACGLHITFAPVADVNRNVQNPIIGIRAFGTAPAATAHLVQTYIRACQVEGLLTTAKHFPGHGDTATDSHAVLPFVEGTRAGLMETDLVPFRTAIGTGVDLVMTAHVAYPAFDPDGTPATLSRPILHDLLRGELGFQGSVITDSLLMGAIRETHPDPGTQAVALVQAGVDILLDMPMPEAAVTGLVQAVEQGLLPEARLEEAFQRVWALKTRMRQRFSPHVFALPPVPLSAVGTPHHRRQAATVACRAVTVFDALPGLLPLDPDHAFRDGLLAVFIKPHRARFDPPVSPFLQAMRHAFPGVHTADVGPETDATTYARLHELAAQVPLVVVAMVVRPAAWHTFGLLPAQQQFIEALTAHQPVLLAALGSPVVLDRFPHAAARLCTWSDVPVSQQALVAVLQEGFQKEGAEL
jgi:beta-glucosidase-like glycosyl hydrolase